MGHVQPRGIPFPFSVDVARFVCHHPRHTETPMEQLHITVHHTFSFDGVPETVALTLVDLSTHVHELLARTGKIMADASSMKADLDRIDAATNNIAAEVKSLKGQIGTGMSQTDVDAVQARLDQTVSALEAIAADGTSGTSETGSTGDGTGVGSVTPPGA